MTVGLGIGAKEHPVYGGEWYRMNIYFFKLLPRQKGLLHRL